MVRRPILSMLSLCAVTTCAATESASPPEVSLSGYLETFYSWNTNQPAGGVTAYRGFDNRHDSLTISNVVIGAGWSRDDVRIDLAFQAGHTPESYYLAEPTETPVAGAGATGPDVWKYLQRATLGWRAPLERPLWIDMGLVLSPIGPEAIAVKDNWNWSRSNLFFGLPFYHTGLHATFEPGDRWTTQAMVVNGWNSVTDGNRRKSIALQGVYTLPDRVTWSLLYFGGAERAPEAPEGLHWRHLFDTWATVVVSPRVAFQAHADGGWEDNRFGTSRWIAGALAVRLKAAPWLHVAARADRFRETVASGAAGAATPIFWPVDRVSSLTVTLDARPAENLSVRLEHRRDGASDPLFFEGAQTAPSSTSQRTITLGMTAWF